MQEAGEARRCDPVAHQPARHMPLVQTPRTTRKTHARPVRRGTENRNPPPPEDAGDGMTPEYIAGVVIVFIVTAAAIYYAHHIRK